MNIREQLDLSTQIPEVLALMLGTQHIREALIICTCNRTELYAVTTPENKIDLAGILSVFKNIPHKTIRNASRLLQDQNAVEHLMRLSCGLESMVVGETEILGQVKRAYATALTNDAAGKVLSLLFQRSFSLAKQIRSGTAIDKSKVSIASVAVDEIARRTPEISTAEIVIWGTGPVSRAVIGALVKYGARGGTVLSRNLPRARVLTHDWQGQAKASSCAKSLLDSSDIFIACTSAPHHIVKTDMLKKRDPDKPLLLVDLAMPRNVETGVEKIPGINVINMDLLGRISQQAQQERIKARAQLIPLIEAEAEAAWLCTNARISEQCLAAWQTEAQQILLEEQQQILNDNPDIPPELREKFINLGKSLLRRMLKRPNKAMACAMRQGLPCAEAVIHMHKNESKHEPDDL